MKITKAFTVFAAATFAAGAFADAKNVLIAFSTEADYYADGTPVLDGEWYALCWANDGAFDGIKLDYTPVNPDEKVLKMYPLAENGHCPYVVFQVDSKVAPKDGEYFVYVLDTRNAARNAVAKADKNGVPEEINGLVASRSISASIQENNTMSAIKVSDGGSSIDGVWVESAIVDSDFKQPTITAFKVENATVRITVSDMIPGVKYNVHMGESPSNFSSYGLDIPKTVVDDPTFVLDPGDAKFFKVVRQPLAE